MKRLFKGPAASLSIYWEAYGGLAALKYSLYFWASVVLGTIITGKYLNDPNPWDWSSHVLNILPNILGFSLGGYAILVGFGDQEFLKILRGRDPDGTPSPYMEVNGAFVHFILIQAMCLIFAIFAESLSINTVLFVYWIGTTLLIYAVFSIIATTLAILNMADWFDQGDI